jgi:hypothetical protein
VGIWRSVLSVQQIPRTIDRSSGWGCLTYSKPQQYLAIRLSWELPPDSPYRTSIRSEGIIEWTSTTVYLRLCSLAGVMAYRRARQDDSKKRIMAVCMVYALVPILNSAFYALNSRYYARCFYMPVLILASKTVSAWEDPSLDLDRPARSNASVMIATLAFALVPVHDAATKEWSLGVQQNPGQYCTVLAYGLGGMAVYHCICRRWQQRRFFASRQMAGVLAFSYLIGIVHIGTGKFAQ